MLRVDEDRLSAGFWMVPDDQIYDRRRSGPLIVIQPTPRFKLRVISLGPKYTASPLQRLTEPFEQPVRRCTYLRTGCPRSDPVLRSRGVSTQVWYAPYARSLSATSVPHPEARHTCCPTFWSRLAELPDGLGASRRPRDEDRSARKCDLALRRQRLFPKDENQMNEKHSMDKSEGRFIGRARQAKTNYHAPSTSLTGQNVSSIEFTYPSIEKICVSAIA